MERPEGSPDTVVVQKDAKDSPFGIYAGETESHKFEEPAHMEMLPEPLRVASGHGGSHPHITHEFIRCIVEDRRPDVDIYEAIAYTLPGLIAHQSALEGGRRLPIRDYAPACLIASDYLKTSGEKYATITPNSTSSTSHQVMTLLSIVLPKPERRAGLDQLKVWVSLLGGRRRRGE